MSQHARVFAAALALLAVTTPARAAVKSEIVLIADGPSYTTLTLSSGVFFDFYKMSTTSSSPYVFIAVNQGAKATAAYMRIPKIDLTRTFLDSSAPSGRSTIRVLVTGKTTLRIPVTGMNGVRTLKLTKRDTASVAAFRELAADPLAVTVKDDIPFQTRADALVVHGFSRRFGTGASATHTFCVAAAGKGCLPPVVPGHPETILINGWKERSSHGYIEHNGAGADPRPPLHWLFAVPLS